jgi:putative ATPase
MTSLFAEDEVATGVQKNAVGYQPLAERLRPASLESVLGQEHVLSQHTVLGRMLESGHVYSLILWGPPGCGKTTIAKLLASQVQHSYFELVSAVSSGVAELKKIFSAAKDQKKKGVQTFLMVDEIHRFNRAQQDAFLPYVEDGTIILIGATTENPSFELNAALLSRCKVVVLHRLDTEALISLLSRAEDQMGRKLPLTDDSRETLCAMADGDGRYLLGMCEELFELPDDALLDPAQLAEVVRKRVPLYDKHQDSHYNLISALHKSLRGSDVNAALYWFARMLSGGEDPMYILRRLIRFAVEDIGLADPQALTQSIAAKDAYHMLGMPEGELAIAQLVSYLATAPKSNAVYSAYKQVMKDAKIHGSLMPPKHILNAPTKLMEQEGYSEGYQYDHDTPEGFSGQNYFPDEMSRKEYYTPVERGFEREIKKRLHYWQSLREKKSC